MWIFGWHAGLPHQRGWPQRAGPASLVGSLVAPLVASAFAASLVASLVGVAGLDMAKEEAAKEDWEMEVVVAVKAAMLRAAVLTKVAVWEAVATVAAKEGAMGAVMEAVVGNAGLV